MKPIFRLLSLIIVLLLSVTGLSPEVSAAEAQTKAQSIYVALGDSITSGYGLESFTNNDVKNRNSSNNFVTKLGKRLGMKTVNFGVEGITSSALLSSLKKPSTAEQKNAVAQIREAGLITLSIGGNNVFIPLLNAVNDQLGTGKSIFNAGASELQNAILQLLFNEELLNKLKGNISAGAEAFAGNDKLHKSGELSDIIRTIKDLNPKAKLVVQTVYDPYGFILPDTVGKAIDTMNAAIIKQAGGGKNFAVADVGSAFKKAGKGMQLLNADSGKTFDPHPTKKGHEVIYTLMAYAADNNRLPYNLKASVVKGAAAVSISGGEFRITITPSKGFKLPQTIYMTVGKSVKYNLTLKNATAAIPVAKINGDIAITAVCTR